MSWRSPTSGRYRAPTCRLSCIWSCFICSAHTSRYIACQINRTRRMPGKILANRSLSARFAAAACMCRSPSSCCQIGSITTSDLSAKFSAGTPRTTAAGRAQSTHSHQVCSAGGGSDVTAATEQRWQMAQERWPLPCGLMRLSPGRCCLRTLQRTACSSAHVAYVAKVIRLSISDATLACRQNMFGELEMLLSPYGFSVMDALPADLSDVCLFWDSKYQHERTGPVLSGGSHISASPVSI